MEQKFFTHLSPIDKSDLHCVIFIFIHMRTQNDSCLSKTPLSTNRRAIYVNLKSSALQISGPY